MAKIKNNFLKATINKDFDERLTPNGQMTDAENVMVTSEDNGNVGVLKNVRGNIKVTSLNFEGAETIGSISEDAKNRCFYFVTSDDYDYVIQYNLGDSSTEIVLQSTSNTGVLNFNRDYRISHSDVFVSVDGDDLLSWTDGLNPPRIINIEKSKNYTIDGFTNTEISVMKPSPIFAPNAIPSQSLNADFSGFIRDKFLTFGYRYRYEDGYYSAISSWSPYVFTPGNFSVDLDTSTNLAMENNTKAFEITFNTGPRSVKDIELLFKVSNSSTVYSIIKLNKEDEGWSDNASNNFVFDSYKIYNVLPESQYFRSFDNVPLTAKTQARIGNRLVYGNYVENRDIDSKIDFSVDYQSIVPGIKDIDAGLDVIGEAINTPIVDFWREDIDQKTGDFVNISMNYETNECTITSTYPGDRSIRLYTEIDKESTFSDRDLTINTFSNSVLIDSEVIPTTQSSYDFFNTTTLITLPASGSVVIKIESSSSIPVLFKYLLKVEIVEQISFINVATRVFDTNGYYQVSYNDTDIRPRAKVLLDMSDVSLESGSQFSINFNLNTHFDTQLYPTTNPSLYNYIYTLSSTYSDFTDFIDNSSFLSNLNTFFQDVLSNVDGAIQFATIDSVSNIATVINYINKSVDLTIPYRVIEIEENGNPGNTEFKPDFIMCESSQLISSSSFLYASMHSSRDYEVGIVFLDEEGRKTTVIDSKNNSTYVETVNSASQNTLKVTLNGTPPSWSKYYKFAVKYNKNKYETIYTNRIYVNGNFTYIQLVGDNKSKVNDGDYLVIKSDLNGPLSEYIKVKVLDARPYVKDEIVTDSEAGFYFKIKAGSFDLQVDGEQALSFIGKYGEYKNPYFVESSLIVDDSSNPIQFESGNVVRFVSYCNRSYGSRTFSNEIDQEYLLPSDYSNFREMFEDIIEPSAAYIKFSQEGSVQMNIKWFNVNQVGFQANTTSDGSRRIRQQTNVFLSKTKIPVFETIPIETDNDSYIETPNTYTISNGQYEASSHLLSDLFNCYSFGNGVESISVRDELATNFLNIDYSTNAVSEDIYRQVNRYADLTYSGVYQEGTNINMLNEFNLSLANYKDDIEKSYGEIIRLDAESTDILVIQEDRWSKVLYGKDLLYNTDATTNLSRIESVLGQQVIYGGEYGISIHPESFDEYGTNSFSTDVKRGVVLRFNDSNGLNDISNTGLRDYFKVLFRDNEIVNIISQYDSFFNVWILNIKYIIKGKIYEIGSKGYDYVTWIYSPDVNGFLGRQTFDPDSMLRVNNELLSFLGSDVYRHNVGPYSTFYGTEYEISFAFNFNEEPSTRKIFKNISIEGNSVWNVNLKTEMQNGYIDETDFINKEEVQYAYIRGNDLLDLSTISVIGLGEIQNISGLNVVLSEVPNTLSVGDSVWKSNLVPIGEVTQINNGVISLTAVSGISVGDFILSSKPSSVETSGIRGYYMNVSLYSNPSDYVEVYAVNSEVSKSFE